jgi:hypothetical protein
MGPCSFAYCRDCSRQSLEPYAAILGGLMGYTRKEDIDPWLWEFIVVPSLEAQGISEEQLWKSLADSAAEYAAHFEEGAKEVEASGNVPPCEPQDLGPTPDELKVPLPCEQKEDG